MKDKLSLVSCQILEGENIETNKMERLEKIKLEIQGEIKKSKAMKEEYYTSIELSEKLKYFLKKLIAAVQFKLFKFQDENYLKKKFVAQSERVQIFDQIETIIEQERNLINIYEHIFLKKDTAN